MQVTPETLQRKRRKAAIKKARYEKSKAEAAEYHKLLMQVGLIKHRRGMLNTSCFDNAAEGDLSRKTWTVGVGQCAALAADLTPAR